MLDSIPEQQFEFLNCSRGKTLLLVTLLKSAGSVQILSSLILIS